jgi:hypothetical protein
VSRRSPIFAVVYREGPAIASHLCMSRKTVQRFWGDRHAWREDLKRVHALQGILSGASKSLGKPENNG